MPCGATQHRDAAPAFYPPVIMVSFSSMGLSAVDYMAWKVHHHRNGSEEKNGNRTRFKVWPWGVLWVGAPSACESV